jgi:hypothetical protein
MAKKIQLLVVLCALCGLARIATAGTITFGGLITQSILDGTGPAVNNLSLNDILDAQGYLVTLAFSGGIVAPGTYDLTGSALTFSDPTAPATESGFDSISLTITANGSFDDISLLACLIGTGCGDQLTANFRILAVALTSQGVAATGLDPPHPLDLLEDGGTTDIHGSITSFSNTSVPEPSTLALWGFALVVLAVVAKKRIKGETV